MKPKHVILIVDDDADDREIMKDAFTNVYKTQLAYKVPIRIAAYMVAIDKVAKTYKYRGGY